jgi:nucleotidyltransferase substrate binding protein (TIGR01987 family)
MNQQDARWVRRFNNFAKAFAQLREAVELSRQRELSKLEQQGLIQAFEYTHELAWKTMKDFLEERGRQNIYGSKDATREAYKAGLINNGEVWMEMVQSRNLTSHTYNEETATTVLSAIVRDCRAFLHPHYATHEHRRFSWGRDTLRAAIARQSLNAYYAEFAAFYSHMQQLIESEGHL